MIDFFRLDQRATEDDLGMIPMFLSELNPDKAAVQFDRAYSHGGGWSPLKGWQRHGTMGIVYPGDEPLQPLAEARLGDEIIRVYESAWVMIMQPNGEFEVARMD